MRLVTRSLIASSILSGNAYHSAASCFVSVTSDIQGTFSDVLSGSDIATYGSICALASFSRKELKDHVLNNHEFKKLLDLNTAATGASWKVILQQFYNSNYGKVFELLEQIKVRKREQRRANARGASLVAVPVR